MNTPTLLAVVLDDDRICAYIATQYPESSEELDHSYMELEFALNPFFNNEQCTWRKPTSEDKTAWEKSLTPIILI